MNPIKVNEIKLTSTTKKFTGYETIQELMANKKTLFSGYTDQKILELIVQLYNNKLSDADFAVIKALSTEAKIEHAKSNLTLTMELTQEVDRLGQEGINVLAHFMSSRINIGSSRSLKYAWQTVTVGNLSGITEGMNFSEFMNDSNVFVYLKREISFDPEIRNGMVTSAPKRTSKGGDVLTKEGKLLFQTTSLVMRELKDNETFEGLYNFYQKEEQENTELFKHDRSESISADQVPNEDRVNGMFNQEFQLWLNNKVAEYKNLHTEIVNAA